MKMQYKALILGGLAGLFLAPHGAQAHDYNATCGQTVEFLNIGNTRISLGSTQPCPVVVKRVEAPKVVYYYEAVPIGVNSYSRGMAPVRYIYKDPVPYYGWYYKDRRHDDWHDNRRSGRHDYDDDHDHDHDRRH